jgi:tetratricopeptide (TPR) repeat protein
VKPKPHAETPYTLPALQALLGLSRRTIVRLIDAGFVMPALGTRGEYRFGFQDVVLLRTAAGLLAADIPPQRILRALARLRARLPAEVPLSGLRIAANGREVTVREGGAQWNADSGQLLIDFQVEPARGGAIAIFPVATPGATGAQGAPGASGAPAAAPAAPALSAQDWFDRAVALETDDAVAAEAAYRAALRLDPRCADATLNLGALLGEQARPEEALAVYDAALAAGDDTALLHYNRAIVCEDLGREDEALAAYQRCLQRQPDLADAHYNLAGLLEQRGDSRAALRHLNAYRKHSRPLTR